MTRLYIAGPISLGGTSSPAAIEARLAVFRDVEARLRAAGFGVENPARNEKPNDHATWLDWMRLGLAQLIRCDGVAILEGWEQSEGAVVEVDLAIALGLPCRMWSAWSENPDGAA